MHVPTNARARARRRYAKLWRSANVSMTRGMSGKGYSEPLFGGGGGAREIEHEGADRATPARARESAARGSASDVAARIASGMPGIWRASTREVASGVTSRGAHPVPPVVKTRSHREVRSARAVSMSVDARPRCRRSHVDDGERPRDRGVPRVAAITDGPLKSSYSPADARSEHVSTPNRTRAPFPVGARRSSPPARSPTARPPVHSTPRSPSRTHRSASIHLQ